MNINKIEYGGNVLVDLTEDTVAPETLADGFTALASNGSLITGQMTGGGGTTLAMLVGNSATSLVASEPLSIPANRFASRDDIETVRLTGTTVIPYYAFAYCSALTNVHVPSAERIGAMAFYRCPMLESLVIPSQNLYIDANAFTSCSALSSIGRSVLGDDVYIGNAAFAYCAALSGTVTYGNSSIGTSAFAGTGITSFRGTHIQDLNPWVFGSCSALRYVSCPSATTVASGVFANCYALSHVTLGEWTQPVIRASTFSNCSLISMVDVPNSQPVGVWYVDTQAFCGCSNLQSVFFVPSFISDEESGEVYGCTIGYRAFFSCRSLSLSVGWFSAVVYVGTDAFYGCSLITELRLPSIMSVSDGAGVINLEDWAFGATGLTSLVDNAMFPQVTSVSSYMFFDGTVSPFVDCHSLSYISLTKVRELAYGCFQNCGIDSGLTLSTSSMRYITTIPERTFAGAGLVSVPSTVFPIVSKIGVEAFAGCSRLSYVRFSALTELQDSAFQSTGIQNITSLTHPLISYIPYAAYANCLSLSSVALSTSVYEIGEGAFSGCSSLSYANLGSAAYIGAYAFYGAKLETLTGITQVSYVGEEAFAGNGMIAIASARFSRSGVTLGLGAFANCSNITYVSLYSATNNCDDYVFNGCTSLTNYRQYYGPLYLGWFDNDTPLTTLYMPFGHASSDYYMYVNDLYTLFYTPWNSHLSYVYVPSSVYTYVKSAMSADGLSSWFTLRSWAEPSV